MSVEVDGAIKFSNHAYEEMDSDDLDEVDCVNVLRAGWVEPAELQRRGYTYRVRSNKIYVVVAFVSQNVLRVVTTWRVRK